MHDGKRRQPSRSGATAAAMSMPAGVPGAGATAPAAPGAFDAPEPAERLPARRVDARGRVRIDYRAVLWLAAPLFVNSAVQAALNVTDTWFVGRISTEATAAMGAVYWLVLGAFFLIGGAGMGVQTLVAQAYGAGRLHDAARALWTGLWIALGVAPLFVAAGAAGAALLRAFALDPAIEAHALEYWWPRLAGGGIGVALWAACGFFNGIGRTRVSLGIMLVVACINVPLTELLMFRLGWGMAGAAWATNLAMLIGVAVALSLFFAPSVRAEFGSHHGWRPERARLVRLLWLGFPIGLAIAADMLGTALFQLMQVQLGAVDGAATQIVMILTALAFLPAVGIGMAGTTLVGQSVGAGDRDWAERLGNAIIRLTLIYMGVVGLAVALAAPWLLPLFVAAGDPNAAATIALGNQLVWIAAIYQVFDALHLGSTFSLRGAGDTRVPAALLMALSWLFFVPLAHTLTFAPGQGWIDGLPQAGWGAAGGWIALTAYVTVLGVTLLLRWRGGTWRRMQTH
jgi:MATE family multidrug resistance protein